MSGRKRARNYADNPSASSSVYEVAQQDYHKKVPVDPLTKLDKEYPGWRNADYQKRKINMVPAIFNDMATKNSRNGRNAERKLFKTLQQSNNAFKHFTPGPGRGRDSNPFIFHGQKYEGTEVDYLYVDRTGVTVYECKGITTPEQAQEKYDDACAQLNDSIPKLGLDDDIPVNHVVAFPLCKRTDIEKDGNVQVMFKEDCQNPDSFNKWLSHSFKEKYFTDITLEFERYVEVVQRFLLEYHGDKNYYDFKRRAIINTADQLERATHKFYTKEQAEILLTGRLKDIWVEGSAGSGKTFLLIEAVKELVKRYEENKGNRPILVVTYNVAINEELKLVLKEYIDEKLIRVQTFCGMLKHILLFESVKLKDVCDADLVEHILHERGILTRYFKRKGMKKYRHIFVDESQDLSGKWVTLMKKLLNGHEQSNIWVFSDPYQTVRRDIVMPTVTETEHFEKRFVTRVLRNTHEVFEAYEHCFHGRRHHRIKPIVDHDVYGVSPEYISVESDEELLHQVMLKLKELSQKHVSFLDIAILTPGQGPICPSGQLPWPERARRFLEDEKLPCTDAEEGTKNRHLKKKKENPPVIVDSVQRFKGLEAKVLIFCIVGDWSPRDEDIYVAFSRSFCHLIVFGKTKMLQEIEGKQAKKQESDQAANN